MQDTILCVQNENYRQKCYSFEVKSPGENPTICQHLSDKNIFFWEPINILDEKTVLSLNHIDKTSKHEKKLSKLNKLKYNTENLKYTIFWFNPEENDRVYNIKLELPHQCSVEDCIVQSIKYLNNEFKNLSTPFSLKEKPQLYNLYQAKKNGKPKEDYPCLEYTHIISQTKITNFSLIQKKGCDIPDEIIISTKSPHHASSFLIAHQNYSMKSETSNFHKNEKINLPLEDEYCYSCLCLKIRKK